MGAGTFAGGRARLSRQPLMVAIAPLLKHVAKACGVRGACSRFGIGCVVESGCKPHALHTLRDLSSVVCV